MDCPVLTDQWGIPGILLNTSRQSRELHLFPWCFIGKLLVIYWFQSLVLVYYNTV